MASRTGCVGLQEDGAVLTEANFDRLPGGWIERRRMVAGALAARVAWGERTRR